MYCQNKLPVNARHLCYDQIENTMEKIHKKLVLQKNKEPKKAIVRETPPIKEQIFKKQLKWQPGAQNAMNTQYVLETKQPIYSMKPDMQIKLYCS